MTHSTARKSWRILRVSCAILGLALAGAPAHAAPAALAGLSPQEMKADAVWKVRAGLNVAALQCQFSPFLATVPTYNALLRQHSDELAQAFKVMTGYFVRTMGQRAGQRAFDTYATRTNQSWATFDAQLSFCDAAARTARRALWAPKGTFASFAEAELPGMLESLTGNARSPLIDVRLEWAQVPDLTDPCFGKSRRRCR